MRHLNQWIIHELKPEKIQRSKTTNSYYYVINGISIRMSNHPSGHGENDIYITVVQDISTFNKTYQIQYDKHSYILNSNKVSEVKVILKTLLVHMRWVKESEKVEGNVYETINKIIQKLHNGKEITSNETTTLGNGIIKFFPKYSYLNKNLRHTYITMLKAGYSLEEVNRIFIAICPKILNNGYTPNEEVQKEIADEINNFYLSENNNKITAPVEKKNVNNKSSNNEITDSVELNKAKEQYISIIHNPYIITQQGDVQQRENALKDAIKNKQYDKLEKRTMINLRFHELMTELFKEKWKDNTTTKQKLVFKTLVSEKNIPYNTVIRLFDDITEVTQKHTVIPDTIHLKEISKVFVKEYNEQIQKVA